MYDAMFQDIIDEDHHDIASRILRWLVVSYEPLSFVEISELSGISVSSDLESDSKIENRRLTTDAILGLLQGIVSITQLHPTPLRSPRRLFLVFSHFSVREYLIGRLPPDATRSIANQFRFDTATAHCLVAQQCLAYLYHRLPRDRRLLLYARHHWPSHCIAALHTDVFLPAEVERLTEQIWEGDLRDLGNDLPAEVANATGWIKGPASLRRLLVKLKEHRYLH
ncbi:hypothetical protein Q7P35_004298 [Cladosporium inversicolor]